MITLRLSEDRGQGQFSWLDSRHTFSFGGYYDSRYMGFSALRVINDDLVKPGTGFATHGHRDMEIISLVLEGAIEHKDSEGHSQILPAGEFQLMSAGSGIRHSEYNASDDDNLRFLQIWIEPNVKGGEPGYQQKRFEDHLGLTPIVTPDGANGTMVIKQDASLSRLILEPGGELTLTIQPGRRLFVHQIKGLLNMEGNQLKAGDGAAIEGEEEIEINNPGTEMLTALVFDLP